MQEQIDDSKIFQFLFMELVYSFQNMAIMQLGKIVNPVTSKVEKICHRQKLQLIC